MRNINKLFDLSQQIVVLLKDNDSIILTDEEKDSLMDALNSLKFFSEEGNLDRAIMEAEIVLKKIKESYS
jgi:hypothetical protein